MDSFEFSIEVNGKRSNMKVPSLCGVRGNLPADFLAKKRTATIQKSCRHLPLHSVKFEIKGIFKQSFHHVTSFADDDKSWRVLRGSQCVLDSPLVAATICRLLTKTIVLVPICFFLT
ncbi:hypothetical protein NPIL_38381 [Nephila pilipes]|uniref:Uncharacterized protein n=1 Tax=Nephila pilipes TaxID=299642 RepID=A0A8X6NMI4_NEPPI|nr:hypothetical protein NPIL_38381 [Nephila pilipes]